jgi:hypothetical protein
VRNPPITSGLLGKTNPGHCNAALGPVSQEEEQRFHGESSVSPLMLEVAAPESFAAAVQVPMSRDDGRLSCRVPGGGEPPPPAATVCVRSKSHGLPRELNRRVETSF